MLQPLNSARDISCQNSRAIQSRVTYYQPFRNQKN